MAAIHRKAFLKLLAHDQGLLVNLDVEVDYGQLFWFMGEEMDYTPGSNYLLVEEIEKALRKGW